MRIMAPIEDGYLGFKHPQEAAVGEYLRKRFRIAESKEVLNPPLAPDSDIALGLNLWPPRRYESRAVSGRQWKGGWQ
jgi:hypothetical protein